VLAGLNVAIMIISPNAGTQQARRGTKPAIATTAASARSSATTNGTVGLELSECLSLAAYPQKIAVGSRSISCRRSSIRGDGGSWS
jgi:hypothetical protein